MISGAREGEGGDGPEVTLDLNLAPELLLDLALDELVLVEALEGDDVLWFDLGAGHVDATELALAEWTTDLERGQRPRSDRGSDRPQSAGEVHGEKIGRKGARVYGEDVGGSRGSGTVALAVDPGKVPLESAVVAADLALEFAVLADEEVRGG